MTLSSKLKILVFIDWYIPGHKAGGPIRSCANLVEHLKEDFRFYIVTRDTDYMDDQPYPSVKSNEWNHLDDGSMVYYLSNDQLNKKNIVALIEEQDYDHIYINGVYSYYFSILPLKLSKKLKARNIIVAARGMLAESAVNIKPAKKNIFLRYARWTKLYKNISFHATNNSEALDIKKQAGYSAQITIAPNLPGIYPDITLNKREKPSGQLRLVNVARIAPEKNLKYALEVLCKIEGDIQFDIFGPIYDQKYWRECQEQIALMDKNIKVVHRGSVAHEELTETLTEYHFMLMPTRGENFGHIILESMISGCPVIISDQTPWRELEEKGIGWDISLSDKSRFVEVINSCVEIDQEEYNEISQHAFDHALSVVNDKQTIEQSKRLFANS